MLFCDFLGVLEPKSTFSKTLIRSTGAAQNQQRTQLFPCFSAVCRCETQLLFFMNEKTLTSKNALQGNSHFRVKCVCLLKKGACLNDLVVKVPFFQKQTLKKMLLSEVTLVQTDVFSQHCKMFCKAKTQGRTFFQRKKQGFLSVCKAVLPNLNFF